MARFGKKEFIHTNIDELLDMQHNQLLAKVERWTYKGLDWTIYLILQHQLVTSETAPCEKSSYFPLPKDVSKKFSKRID